MITLALIDYNSNLDRFRDLYFMAFPPDERRPWDDLLEKINSCPIFESYYILDDNEEFVGFVTTWHLGNAIYIEHFAILPSRRGEGLGSRTLQCIAEASDMPIILEVEPASLSDEARRRVAFYRSNGFTPYTDFKYVQPAYSPELQPVEMTLMSRGCVNPEDIETQLYSKVYGCGL
jgi:ribosomal protein S18 acetylase RimI-like enzyme